MQKAVILLSGGLDSATCLAIAKSRGYACYTLSFAYGQRHDVELQAAGRVARALQAEDHKIMTLDTAAFVDSALTDKNRKVPDFQGGEEIPTTYVPARNTVFLAMALAYAESLGASIIFIGASSVDYSHYPDCRPEFMEAFQALIGLATKTGVEGKVIQLEAPLQRLSKAETIILGSSLGVPYNLTVSCYQANALGEACGSCDSCTFRRKGFITAKIDDPTLYQK
jgi:7-cyano-7-deazaguanine synthase